MKEKKNESIVPKVSIIMLAYNIEKYIATAIEGVLKQSTLFPIQLVISEDCSTDHTLEICQKYKEQYWKQITLVQHEKNVGLQRNFMDAYASCKADYIAICDGDDYWIDPNKLQKTVDFMEANPEFAICFHKVINYYEGNRSKSLSNGGQAVVTTINDLAKSNYITNSSSLFRRHYQQLPEWFAEITSCDYAMHLLNAQHGSIYYFKKPMAIYRKHEKGIWSKANEEKKLKAAMHVREKLLRYFKENTSVYEGLLIAQTQIFIALLRIYLQNQQSEKTEQMEKLIQSYHPEWTIKQIRNMVTIETLTWQQYVRKIIKQLLTFGRERISILIPLPKV